MSLRNTLAMAVFVTIIGWLIMFSSIEVDPVALGFLVLGVALILWYDFFSLWFMMRAEAKEEKAYRAREEERFAEMLKETKPSFFDDVMTTKPNIEPPVQDWDGK